MSRSYAQFSTSIWRDADFLALPFAWQRVYMLLSSQPDITAVGVLPLAVNRWARKAPDTTPQDIAVALNGLVRERFIVFDRSTEELFVRSFVRWDNGYKNPKRLHAIRDAADQVESPTIVNALAAEFERLSVAEAFRGQCRGRSEEDAREPPDLTDEHPSLQVDSLSKALTGNEEGPSSNRRRVPQPTTHNPQPVPPPADTADAASALPGMPEAEVPPPNAGPIVAAYCDGAKESGLDKPSGKLCARVGRDAKTLIGEKKDFAKLVAAAKEMGGKGYNDLDVAYRRLDAFLSDRQNGGMDGSRRPRNQHVPHFDPADIAAYKTSKI